MCPSPEQVPGVAAQLGSVSSAAKTLGVPCRCPASGQGVLGQDCAREGHTHRFGKGRASHQRDPSVCSQDFYIPHGKPVLGAQAVPLGCQVVQPKASLQTLLLSHEGCQRNPLFPPGLPSVEGWAL